jgi:hypothetical protein
LSIKFLLMVSLFKHLKNLSKYQEEDRGSLDHLYILRR